MTFSESFVLYPAQIIQIIFVFAAAYGAILLLNLDRYRAFQVFLIFQAVLMLLNLYEAHSEGFLITPVFTLAKGLLLYLFIRDMVGERKLEGFNLYVHFSPMVLAFLIGDAWIAIIMGSISQISYLLASFGLLHRYHRAAQSFRSDADSLKLTWLVKVFWLFTAQVLIGLVRLNMQQSLPTEIASAWYIFDLSLLLGLCCFTLFKLLRQQLYNEMLEHEDVREQGSSTHNEKEADTARSIFAGLESVILEGQLYKQPRLSVADLANATGLQMKDVSWAINLGADKNFNEYINRLRVGALTQQLRSGHASSKSLLELALETGFNSKSSFNAAFKRETGMTPTQYINSSTPADPSATDSPPTI